MQKIKELIGVGNYNLLRKVLIVTGAIAIAGSFFSMFHIRMEGFEMKSYDFSRNAVSIIVLSMIFSVSLLTYLLSIWLSSIKVEPEEDEIVVKKSDLRNIAIANALIMIVGLYFYDKFWKWLGIELHRLSPGYLLSICLFYAFIGVVLVVLSFIKIAKRVNGKS